MKIIGTGKNSNECGILTKKHEFLMPTVLSANSVVHVEDKCLIFPLWNNLHDFRSLLQECLQSFS